MIKYSIIKKNLTCKKEKFWEANWLLKVQGGLIVA